MDGMWVELLKIFSIARKMACYRPKQVFKRNGPGQKSLLKIGLRIASRLKQILK